MGAKKSVARSRYLLQRLELAKHSRYASELLAWLRMIIALHLNK